MDMATVALAEVVFAAVAAIVAVLWLAAWLPTRKVGPWLMFLLTFSLALMFVQTILHFIYSVEWIGWWGLFFLVVATVGCVSVMFLDWFILRGKLEIRKPKINNGKKL
jgi:hypothetical protein